MKRALRLMFTAAAVFVLTSPSRSQGVESWIVQLDQQRKECAITKHMNTIEASFVFKSNYSMGILRIRNPDWHFTDAGFYPLRVIQTFADADTAVRRVNFRTAYGENFMLGTQDYISPEMYEYYVSTGNPPQKLVIDFDGQDDIVIDTSDLSAVLQRYRDCKTQLSKLSKAEAKNRPSNDGVARIGDMGSGEHSLPDIGAYKPGDPTVNDNPFGNGNASDPENHYEPD